MQSPWERDFEHSGNPTTFTYNSLITQAQVSPLTPGAEHEPRIIHNYYFIKWTREP